MTQHTITVTVRRRTGTNRYGDPSGTTTHEVAGCMFSPASGDAGQAGSDERTGLRDTVITSPTLYAPPGADITATDEVLIPGVPDWWQVDGEPGHWTSGLTSWAPGTVVALRRVRG